ncbi:MULTISPECIES: phage holin family protein [unclassified Bartonella]|uniref:phage holin family protein n=1 Tax=unclassified Bartonella TaxID=2645622 RepID=UPI00300E1D59
MYMLIAPLFNSLVNGELKNTVKQMRRQAICCGIIGMSLFISLMFLCTIGFIALCSVMTPLAAASTMFFIWLFIAGLGILVNRLLRAHQLHNQQKQLKQQQQKFMTDATLSSIALLSQHLPFAKLGVSVLGLATYLLWKKDKKNRS